MKRIFWLRWVPSLALSLTIAPLFVGCAGNPVPTTPALTGIAAQDAALNDDISRGRHGGLPKFQPLIDAEKAVTHARAQPQVNNYAARLLQQAESALASAKKDWQAIADDAERSDAQLTNVAQKAHRAERLAEIAEYTAQREINLARLNTVNQKLAAQQRSETAVNVRDNQLIGRKVVPAMLGPMEFQPGTARLTEPSHAIVKKLASLLEQHTKIGVAVFAFTDNSAPPEQRLQAFVKANPGLEKQAPSHADQVRAYNTGLSSARARDVAELLVQAGVNPKRIGARGYGSQHPVASNDTAAGRSRNERVEAVIVPLKQNGSS